MKRSERARNWRMTANLPHSLSCSLKVRFENCVYINVELTFYTISVTIFTIGGVLVKRFICAFLAILLCLCVVACDGETKTQNNDTTTGLPFSSNDYESKNYAEVLEDFEAAGFTNIKLEPIYDLITGWLTSDGEVEEISINGSTSFAKGEDYPKDAEIIIKYHTWESAEPQITMPNYSWHYDNGWTVENLINHFQELGFTNIETATTTETGWGAEFHLYGEIFNVTIEDTTLGGWKSGDVFGSTSLITITYYERTPTLTIENCPDLVSILSNRDMTYTEFVEKYDGQFIEFDACITSLVHDVAGAVDAIWVCGGDTINREGHVIHLDTMLTAGDETYIYTNFEEGATVKVVAKIDDYYADYYDAICAKAAYLVER